MTPTPNTPTRAKALKALRELFYITDEPKACELYDVINKYLNAQGRTQSAPEGWKLVPVEPDMDMLFFAFDVSSINRAQCEVVYKAMLQSAPQFKPKLAALLNEPSILEAAPPVTAPIEKVDGLAEACKAGDFAMIFLRGCISGACRNI